MTKTLVIILTFNRDGKEENIKIWENVIKSWVMQRNENQQIDIIIADTQSHLNARQKLKEFAKKYALKLLFIDDHLLEHQAVNLALSSFKGMYNYYVINTSDAALTTNKDVENLIVDINYYPDTAFLIPTVNHDIESGYECWHTGPGYPRNIQWIHNNQPPTQFSVPYWPRAHCIFYKKEFLEKYDYKVTDLTGSAYAQICTATFAVAVKMKGAICHKVHQNHKGQMEMDGLCFYDFPQPEWAGISRADLNVNPNDHKPLCWAYFYDMIKKGEPLGLSYGHYLGGACEIHDPDPNAFDEQGFPKRADELYEYIKEHFFLKEEHFNYRKVKFTLHN